MATEFPFVRRPWQRHRLITEITGESRTHQSHAESCDINHIIRRFDNTGLLPDGRGPGQYEDVTHLQNKQTDELILESRKSLETADADLKSHKRKLAKAEKDRVAALEAENKKLKESVTPPSPPKTQNKPDPTDD